MRKSRLSADLVDITTIKVDSNLPKSEKIVSFVKQIKTPNQYMCGKFKVTVIHPSTGPSLEDCLRGMFV